MMFVNEIFSKDSDNGIDVKSLKPGTKLEVKTKNSLYLIEILDTKGSIRIQGGNFFVEPTETYLVGSTWGGSMIKMGWIGYDMLMEIARKDKSPITTSPVRAAKVIGSNWTFEMDWPID